MKSISERTPNNTLLLTATLDFGDGPVLDCIVLQIQDRFDKTYHPDPRETDVLQDRLDLQLQGYRTRRKLDELPSHECECGLKRGLCTIHPGQGYTYG